MTIHHFSIKKFSWRTVWICALGLAWFATALAQGQAPPETFTRTVSGPGGSVTVDFVRHPIRSSNFQVWVQGAGGSFTAWEPGEARTYLGTVHDHPGAIATGLLRANGTLFCRIAFENGVEWSSTGGTASVRGSTNWEPAWPTLVVGPGGAGSSVRMAEVGVDCSYRQYLACGSSFETTVQMAEFSVMATNSTYLRDAAIVHHVGKIIIRSNAAADPYEPLGSDTNPQLTTLRSQWNSSTTLPGGNTHDIALVAKPGSNGGLAYVGAIATNNKYSANDADANGDFSIVWRHEAGHNWGSNHYEGGGRPEGPTIMSDNALSRFSSSELARIIAHRNSRQSFLDNLGPYPFPLPPRANQDRATFLAGAATTFDVLANDSDSNGEAISLLSFDETSTAGGTLARSEGTGPGGRDEIAYTPPPGFSSGTDWFSYRIVDESGRTATGYVTVRPVAEALFPVDHWPLDEASGTTAFNPIRSNRNGTHQEGAVSGQPGANAVTGRGVYYDGNNDRTSITNPGYNTNTLTITVWVKRDGAQQAWAPFIFTRAGSSVAGFGFGTTPELRYHWDDTGHDFASGLAVPDNQWCLAAMAVSSGGVTLHLRTPEGLQSATHSAALAAEAFNGTMFLARDNATGNNRYFKGWLDDVRVYNHTLTAQHIESLYQQAVNPPMPAIAAPAADAEISPLDVGIVAEVPATDYVVKGVEFFDGDVPLGVVDAPPFAVTVPAMSPGPHTVTARVSFGDWGYSVDSAPVAFTALEPPLPVVTFATAGIPSRLGPISADFVVVRSHPIGELTVPLVVSGSAIPGTDYLPLPASVTLPDGALSATVTLMPVAGPPVAEEKSVTLVAAESEFFVTGEPSSATLLIGDHVTSIANGAWNIGATWIDEQPAAISGPQNNGKDYAVAHTVTSNNTGSNSQALIARSLRIENGGILDLARLHDSTNQNVSYNLPATRLEDGGSIRFRASNGSVSHIFTAALTNSGTSALRITGGNYANNVSLSGPLSGSGSIAVVSESNAGSTPANVRQVSVNFPNNSFSGNWSVIHQASGDDFAALRAAAPNALGSGTVTVGTRSRLVNDAANGLNSLAGVVMNGANSALQLNQPWNNSAASLALTGGSPVVTLGNAASSIGNLSGGTGSIAGTGASSALTVNQTADASFGGNLGAPLRFTKNGPATLRLAGSLDPALHLTTADGRLGFGGNAVTVASFTQTGGELLLDLGAPLTVMGNYAHDSGSLTVTAGTLPEPGIAHPLVVYQGTLSGTPPVTFAGQLDPELAAVIDYGSGTDSQITVTFQVPSSQVILTVAASPEEGGTATGGGEYPQGSAVPIEATPTEGWEFTGWTGEGIAEPAAASTTVLLDTAKTVTATFAQLPPPDVTLTVIASPIEGGTVTGGGEHPQGSTVPIEATPTEGWEFTGWTGEGIGDPAAASTTVLLDAAKTVTAIFAFIDPYEFWIAGFDLEGEDALPGADPDGDGVPNREEMLLGFDPTDPGSRLELSLVEIGEESIRLKLNRVVTTGAFTIESSADLADPWTFVPLTVSEDADNFEFEVPREGGRRFYRVVFEAP